MHVVQTETYSHEIFSTLTLTLSYYDMCRDMMICVDDTSNCKNDTMEHLSKSEYCILSKTIYVVSCTMTRLPQNLHVLYLKCNYDLY